MSSSEGMLKAILAKYYYFADQVRRELLTSIVRHFFRYSQVLTYHRVTSHRLDGDPMSVSLNDFRNHIQYLREGGYNIISMDELSNKLRTCSLSSRDVVITFDDGYEDNYIELLPLIQELSVPVTLFTNTAYFNKIAFFEWNQNLDQKARFISQESLQKISSASLVTIGGHAHSHKALKKSIDNSYEVLENLRLLKLLDIKPAYFAYPYGRKLDVCKSAIKLVSKHYRLAFSNMPGVICRFSNMYFLPRYNITNSNFYKIFK